MPSSPRSSSSAVWPAVIIALGALAAYHNSFSVPLMFDDFGSISDNLSIRHLGALGEVLRPPPGITASGRPVLNLSLAVNYAISGPEVWSYHVVNFLIHLGAGLALFGCVQRTLRLPSLAARFGTDARPLALAVALLWTLHPLQTESVTYLVQRAESLMGLFYLLTLYCYLRSVDSATPGRWHALAIAACLLGMGTKEVMVTAPLLVLLHDRAFVAGSFRAAWQQRARLYVGLESTWALLGVLVAASGGNRDGSLGYGSGEPWIAHSLTQFPALACYLRLTFWPHPLIFEYGAFHIQSFAEIAPSLLVVAPLAGLTVFALWRHPRLGFLGAWFFGILALTSVLPGMTQMIVEHRVYLPLAAVLAGSVMAAHVWLGRRSWWLWMALSVVLGIRTERRNHDYRSILAMWQETLAHRPDNVIANSSLGQALLNAQRPAEAVPYYEKALQLAPRMVSAHIELGLALSRTDRADEALAQFREALRLNPLSADAHRDIGALLSRQGRHREALEHLDQAIRLRPDKAESFKETGIALGRAGHMAAAIKNFEYALRLDPGNAGTLNELGYALMRSGRTAEARARFEEVLRLQPDFTSARTNLKLLDASPPSTARP